MLFTSLRIWPVFQKQKLATLNLFEAFDFDGSGALDSKELTSLYNDQGVFVTEDEIR